jgi:hypothetical protein
MHLNLKQEDSGIVFLPRRMIKRKPQIRNWLSARPGIGNLWATRESTGRLPLREVDRGTNLDARSGRYFTLPFVLAAIEGSLNQNPKDLPFTLTCLLEDDVCARLACTSGIDIGHPAAQPRIAIAQADGYTFELFPKPIHPDDLIAKLRGF